MLLLAPWSYCAEWHMTGLLHMYFRWDVQLGSLRHRVIEVTWRNACVEDLKAQMHI